MAWKKYDHLIGQKFGRWKVLAIGPHIKTNPTVVCRCECGTYRLVPPRALPSGRTTCCGCSRAPDPHERFWGQVRIDPSGCWLWTGLTVRGYGRMSICGKQVFVHRWIYEVLRGPIPEGLTADHLCSVRNCVNPWHIDPCTKSENTRRSHDTSPRIRTHCRKGHPFTPENTYARPSGQRQCRACVRVVEQRRRERGRPPRRRK